VEAGKEPAQPFKSFATKADFDEWKTKATEAKDKELARLRREQDEARAKSMTDDEKKMAAAKAEGRKEIETQLETTKREAAVQRHLIAKLGADISDPMLERLTKLVDAEADPKEAVEALAKELPQLFASDKPRGPGGGGGHNPNGGTDEDYSPDVVDARIKELGGIEWFAKNKDKIRAWQAEKYPTAYTRMK